MKDTGHGKGAKEGCYLPSERHCTTKGLGLHECRRRIEFSSVDLHFPISHDAHSPGALIGQLDGIGVFSNA